MSEHGARMALAMMSALGGPVSFPHWKRRLALVPNPERESAAQAKRARKAAKRERDAERTREGRARPFSRRWMGDELSDIWDVPYAHWDVVCSLVDQGFGPGVDPRWRQRLNYRRSLPMPLPWCDCLACRAARSR